MLVVNRVSSGRSHESMIRDLANLVRHKKLCSPFVAAMPRAYVAADNIIIWNKLVRPTFSFRLTLTHPDRSRWSDRPDSAGAELSKCAANAIFRAEQRIGTNRKSRCICWAFFTARIIAITAATDNNVEWYEG